MKANRPRAKAGFTLVEIMCVVAILGVLVAIAIPNYVRARNTSQSNSCIHNMRRIDCAVQQWAMENGKKDSDAPDSAAVVQYIRGSPVMPVCPAGGDYVLAATVGTIPVVNCPNESGVAHKLP